MTWQEDIELWETIDELLTMVYTPITHLCNKMANEYQSELDAVGKGVLFGGLGALVVSYTAYRNEGHTEQEAFGLSIQAVVSNGHFQNMMKEQVVEVVDDKVEKILPLGGDGEVS
jgi:hypothetical protein|tara:strand:- start:678 stop:1022 length:345 start_codon:yes stop_codon:yes gene_type:complete